MRIALVICLFGDEELGSGAVRIVHDLARGLAERHEIHIFAGSRVGPEDFRCEQLGGVRWWRFRIDPFLSPDGVENYRNDHIEALFRRFLHEVRPHVVHFHALQGIGGGVVGLAREWGAYTVIHVHDWWWFCPYLFLTSIDGRICPMDELPYTCQCIGGDFIQQRHSYLWPHFVSADMRIFVSSFIRDHYYLYLSPDVVGLVVENPVNRVSVGRKRHSSLIRFSYFGGDSVHKGFPVLRKAVSRLTGRYKVDYFGFDRPPSRWKGFFLSFLGRGRESFHPRFGHDELPRILEETDVVVVPSLTLESFNLVVREAMVAGIPVIASRSGGPESVVFHGDNGWLFPRGEWIRLADIMQEIIDHPSMLHDVERRLAAKPLRVKEWPEYIAEMEEIYMEGVGGR